MHFQPFVWPKLILVADSNNLSSRLSNINMQNDDMALI